MQNVPDASWHKYLKEEFEKPYFKALRTFLNNEYKNYKCFPPEDAIFNAFTYCPFQDVKVVIIGQDPYHDLHQANGLSFSVNEGIKHPPSLVNIFKEIETDIGVTYPESGDLTRWAKQGVLLLNATLTVRAHQAGSHQKQGWERFTNTVIECMSAQREHLIFLLWGGFAKQKAKLIDKNKHTILMSGHPSPLSANRGYWFGNRHFSKTNAVLQRLNKTEIVW